MTHPASEVAEIARGLSKMARLTIDDGDDQEWYARTERVSDDLYAAKLVRRPFSHDWRILIPNELGLLVRAHLTAEGAGG